MITLRKQPSGCVMVLLCLLYAILLGIYLWAVRVCLNPAQMKVAIYLQFASKAHKDNVITLEFQNQKDIIEISTLWRMEPFLAGSYAIEHSEYYSGKGLY